MDNGEKPIIPFNNGLTQFYGLSKREHFAGLALQGIMAMNANCTEVLSGDDMIKNAVRCADALLKALEASDD